MPGRGVCLAGSAPLSTSRRPPRGLLATRQRFARPPGAVWRLTWMARSREMRWTGVATSRLLCSMCVRGRVGGWGVGRGWGGGGRFIITFPGMRPRLEECLPLAAYCAAGWPNTFASIRFTQTLPQLDGLTPSMLPGPQSHSCFPLGVPAASRDTTRPACIVPALGAALSTHPPTTLACTT